MMRCDACGGVSPHGSLTCLQCGSLLTITVPSTTSFALPRGTKLKEGRFSVGKLLGHGGFGMTYKGADPLLKRVVAIKEFFPEGSLRVGTTVQNRSLSGTDYQSAKKGFLDEASRLAQFNHRGIVSVYDVFPANETAYMVMEYLQGSTLADMVKKQGRLTEQQAIGYVRQIGEALSAVHKANLLHRDVKPDNIIVTADDRAALIDFGAAREFARGKTTSMTRVLTKEYAPLEQWLAQAKFGPYTDVYALGATAYHLLTGCLPVPPLDRRLGVALPPPTALVSGISDRVNKAVLGAMEIRIEDRPQSVAAFLKALGGARRAPRRYG